MEFVLGRFSYFKIEIAYSNSTFCGTWSPSFLWVHLKTVKISAKRSPPRLAKTGWLRQIEHSVPHTRSKVRVPPTVTIGSKRLSCHACHEKVSRCCTRGEAGRSLHTQARLWNLGQASPRVQNRDTSYLQKKDWCLPKIIRKRYLI